MPVSFTIGTRVMRSLQWAVIVASLCATVAYATEAPPEHLTIAEDLVSRIELSHTSYAHGEPSVSWDGQAVSHADCSGFIDELLKRSYGYQRDDFKKWFDSHRPSAKRYHDAIIAQTGFLEIASLNLARPGDFLAVKYLDRTDETGHIMLLADMPRRMPAKEPIVRDTYQWEATVIDSSMSGHGPSDTRHHKGVNGKDHEGLGKGVLRIYTDSHGTVAGFSWSAEVKSKFEAPEAEHLVIGRLVVGFKP